MRGFRIRTCSQGGLAPWPSPWAAPPSMPVENPAAVNSSVRPRSRKRACYGLSRLRTGEAAEAPHRSVRVVTIVGCQLEERTCLPYETTPTDSGVTDYLGVACSQSARGAHRRSSPSLRSDAGSV